MKLKNMNLKHFLFLASVSKGVFSVAVKKICGKDLGTSIDDINDVTKKLNISACNAVNVYDYIVNGEKLFKDALQFDVDVNFSEKKCKEKCKNANKKLINLFKDDERDLIKLYSNELLDLDFISSCESNCHLGALDADVLKKKSLSKTKIESEFKKANKRDDKPCDPVSEGKIVKSPTTPYHFGFYRYTQESGSAKTAISVVNGCGPKNNEQISQIVGSLPYAEEFTPACNSHDICVTCHQLSRSGCDSTFKGNMKSICSTMYEVKSGDNFITKAKKAIKKATCNLTAALFADAVSLFGESAYQNTPVNTSTDCAACGVPLIKDTLYKTPFYVLK